ncbi:MAG: tonB-system energizer ExbB [Xanthobacteraceae bacterium]
MHQGTSARRIGRNWSPVSGHRHAIALAVAALLMVLPLAANSQTVGQGTVAAPAASPATTAPAPATGAAPSAPSQPAQVPASGVSGGSTPSAAAPAAPSASGPATSASAALPGEHMISGADLPEDLSPWGMFENSDLVVKAVIIGLALASLVTWTVWLAKTFELRSARGEVRRDLRVLNNALTLAQAHDQLREGDSPVSRLMRAAGQEIRLSANLRADGLKERIALQLERIEMAVSRKVSRGTGVLATIGSTAPFVGLFGTVWGIMNSFIGISNAHTTNLAVVAPGIAQALLATAFGLIAAIPAVMIYNVLARQTAQYRAYLGDASAQVMRLVSRDLDRAKLPMTQAAE